MRQMNNWFKNLRKQEKKYCFQQKNDSNPNKDIVYLKPGIIIKKQLHFGILGRRKRRRDSIGEGVFNLGSLKLGV